MFGWVYWLCQYTPNRWAPPNPPLICRLVQCIANPPLIRYFPNPRNSLFCNPCLLLSLHPFYSLSPNLPSQLEIHLQPLPPNIKQNLRAKSPPPDSTVSGLRPHCFMLFCFSCRNYFLINRYSLYIADKFSGRVGFLGLGIMGSPMALNLIKAGCDVIVWNRTKSKCDPLISLGAKYSSSPEEVAANCDVTFAMLADPESAIDVACGKNGAVSGMGPGKGYVDVSTVDVATSKLINEHIKARGALFLEAPVSGSKKPAEDGQLIFLTAGDRSLYELVSPLLDILGKSRFYLEKVGNGAAMKLVVNMIMGSMMASFSEGILLSKKVGLDPSVLVEVVSQGPISAPMYSLKGPSMVKSQYPTAFPLKHQQKDLRLALGLAESVSQSTPIAAAANELYKVAKSYGLSDEDFSAVIEALKAKSQDTA